MGPELLLINIIEAMFHGFFLFYRYSAVEIVGKQKTKS